MIRVREDVLLTGVFVALAGIVAATSLALSPVARLAPLAVAIPTLVLLGAEMARQVSGSAGARAEPDRALRCRERGVLAWIAALFVLSCVLGMTAGLPVFVLLYLRVRSRERWAVAAGTAAGLWFVLFGVLSAVLHVHVYEGLLADWITRW